MLQIAAYIFAVCFGVGFGSVAFIRGATRPSTREERRHDYLEVPRT